VTEPEALLLEQLVQALGSIPAGRYLGLRGEINGARVVVTLPGLDRHVGDASRRSVHGGVLAAFLEAAALATLHAQGFGETVRAMSFTSAFVRPAQVVDTCAAVDVVRAGRRIAHVRVGAWQGDVDNFVATGQGAFSLR
jgi:acyl-coenzyme A thioesterase PaaI-like protein